MTHLTERTQGHRAPRHLALVTLATLIATPAPAQEASGSNRGDRPVAAHEPPAFDLDDRRERLRDYLANRRARLDIVATTVTDSGQVIDWIPRSSQTRDGVVASPPPLERSLPAGDATATFELIEQPHARGPAGTVPILRRDVDEVLNGDLPAGVDDFLSKYGRAADRGVVLDRSSGDPAQPGEAAHEYAYSGQRVQNFGGDGFLNVWDPYVFKSSEFSLAQVAVSRGTKGAAVQTVEAGWQDYCDLYGDYSPHLFIFYTTNGYDSQGDNIGGYNLDVDGFVQVSSEIFPGARITGFSSLGGHMKVLSFRVQLYRSNWWIRIKDQWVGYYPAKLFSKNGLRYSAEKIHWYGEIVDADDDINSSTDMGSGQFASEGYKKAAYMRNLRTYHLSDGFAHDYDPDLFLESDPGCYTLKVHALSGTAWGSYLWYGGPGKNPDCP